jgi:hypothetical protein
MNKFVYLNDDSLSIEGSKPIPAQFIESFVCISDDGKHYLTLSIDDLYKLRVTETNEEVARFTEPTLDSQVIIIGGLLYSITRGNHLFIYELNTSTRHYVPIDETDKITVIDGRVFLWVDEAVISAIATDGSIFPIPQVKGVYQFFDKKLYVSTDRNIYQLPLSLADGEIKAIGAFGFDFHEYYISDTHIILRIYDDPCASHRFLVLTRDFFAVVGDFSISQTVKGCILSPEGNRLIATWVLSDLSDEPESEMAASEIALTGVNEKWSMTELGPILGSSSGNDARLYFIKA